MDNETTGLKYSLNNVATWRSFSDPFFRIMLFMDFRSNVPFKICLDSGFGREGGPEGIREYQTEKTLSIKIE